MCRINKQKKTAGREIVLGPAATLNKIIKKVWSKNLFFKIWCKYILKNRHVMVGFVTFLRMPS